MITLRDFAVHARRAMEAGVVNTREDFARLVEEGERLSEEMAHDREKTNEAWREWLRQREEDAGT